MTATIYPGRVAQLDPAGPLVLVPQLGQGVLWGPLSDMSSPPVQEGDQVAVANMGAARDQLVILGRLTGRVPELDEIPGLAQKLDAYDTRLEAVELDNETDGMVLTDHGNRLQLVESTNGQQNTRLTNVEGTANGAASSAAAASGAAAAASTAVDTLRADTAGKATTKGDLLIATGAGVFARQPVVNTGWMLSGDPASPTGWAQRDVLGLPRNLTGAAAPTRFVGGTAGGVPTTGTFAAGDFIVTTTGDLFVCTVAGTPGTWKRIVGDGPRGVLARSRRNTTTLGMNNTASTKISEVSAAVLPGRSIEVRTRCGLYVDGQGNGIVDYHVRYTTNGTPTTATSALLEHVGVFCPPGGYVMPATSEETYVPTAAFTLTIGIYARVAVGTTGGIYSSLTDEWRPRIVIEDKGVDPGITGTQF